jgi:flagellar basal body P-ring formation protein FlgA
METLMPGYRRRIAVTAGFLMLCANALAEPWQDTVAIAAAAEQAVRTHLAAVDGEIGVKAEALDPRLRLAACEQPLRAELPAAARETARLTVAVHCAGSKPWRLHVPVRVSVTRTLVVTATPLPRGKVLTAGDVILAQREVGAAPGGYLTSVDAAVGRVLRRQAAAGVVLAPGLLEAPLLVRRGEPVILQARSGGIAVQMAGVARADGALGDKISVENVSSKKILQGIVRNEKYIDVLLP